MSAEPDPRSTPDVDADSTPAVDADGTGAAGASTSVGSARIEVVRGGCIDASEAAALTVALAAQTAADSVARPDGSDHAWARAARIESIGRPRIDRPSDLDRAD